LPQRNRAMELPDCCSLKEILNLIAAPSHGISQKAVSQKVRTLQYL